MNNLIITNSQGSWLDTNGIPYTKILSRNDTFIYTKSGLDIDFIISNFDDIFKTNQISTVVIQIGIIEISNRILHDRTKRILTNLGFIGKVITKLAWLYKYEWLKIKKFLQIKSYQKVTIEEFKEKNIQLIEMLLKCNIKKIYIVGIPYLDSHYIKTINPYINNIIKESNKLLKTLNYRNVTYLDVSKLLYNNGSYMKGTVHFSKIGHERFAKFLLSNIKEIHDN